MIDSEPTGEAVGRKDITGTLAVADAPSMTTFLDAASERIGSDAARRSFFDAFVAAGLPTTSDEVWRYAPLHDFSLDRFISATNVAIDDDADERSIREGASIVVTMVDGELREVSGQCEGVRVSTRLAGHDLGDRSYIERYRADAFALLNAALSPATVHISIEASVHVAMPIVIVQRAETSLAFANVRVDVGTSASATIVECWFGGSDALVVPVSEYHVAANGSLQLSSYQRLAATSWHVARTTTLLERDARMQQSVIGLGAQYDRARNDAELVGTGASNELHTTFLGSGQQVHDLRTHQFHRVGRTTSSLLSKGAVADESRSVYTGLIEIENGARRTDARQTNHNLLLSPHAHADSVPNLDIRENDVVCAHASSVGPLDEMQRWYLESRGVDRENAERLMVQGFFNEMTDVMPDSVARLVDRDVATVLARATGESA